MHRQAKINMPNLELIGRTMYKYTYPNRYATQKLASALTPNIVILKHTYTVPHARGYTHKHARTRMDADTLTHARTHAHTHARTHAHTHTHSSSQW